MAFHIVSATAPFSAYQKELCNYGRVIHLKFDKQHCYKGKQHNKQCKAGNHEVG